MATECSQEAVYNFLRERGGRVRNVDLTDQFRAAIPKDPALKTLAKENFKRYVDNVAFVKVENGEKYVCLKKKFRASLERIDRNVTADDRLKLHELKSAGENVKNTKAQIEPSESNSEVKESMLPVSGYGTDNAGGAKAEAVKVFEGVNNRTKSELHTDMGNSRSSAKEIRTVLKSEKSLEINQSQPGDKDPRPSKAAMKTLTSDGTERSKNQTQTDGLGGQSQPIEEENKNKNISQYLKPGTSKRLINKLSDGDQGSTSNTPKNSRKNIVEVLMNSSHQVRRDALLRNSFYLSSRCKDCPRGDDFNTDYELATVTLEPLEHEWMMRASEGRWESLRQLLVRDPGLLTKKDFVTGFTCLHWAAKLGKHELIILLVNFAKNHKVSMNINARSSAGYTPLHLAAMHNHVEVVKLLVGAFDADVEARDYSGKKACQYMKSDMAQNILDIVGACVDCDVENAHAGETSRWKLPKVIQANFKPLKSQNLNTHNNSEEDGARDSGGLSKQTSLRRKSSFKMKPTLNKIRHRTQIVHSTSLFDRFHTEEDPNPVRPKSTLFG